MGALAECNLKGHGREQEIVGIDMAVEKRRSPKRQMHLGNTGGKHFIGAGIGLRSGKIVSEVG